MATNITEWAPDIMPDIPGLPTPALIVAVRDAAIEFCEETWLWTYTLEAIDVVADTQDCVMTVPVAQYGEIISIDDVKFKEDGADNDQFRNLYPLSEDEMDLDKMGPWKFLTSTSPSHYFGDNQDKTKISLYPIPTEASGEGLLVRVNLKPTADCTTLPTFLYSEHRKTISFGALAELFLKRTMPWYDPEQAGMYRARFRAGFSDAKFAKLQGPVKMGMSVKMRQFV